MAEIRRGVGFRYIEMPISDLSDCEVGIVYLS